VIAPVTTHTTKPARIEQPPIATVVMQHVEEAAHLRHVRSVLVRAPHVRLLQLGRIDERIAAHLDGVTVAGAFGARLAQEALVDGGKSEVFVATVRALEARDMQALDHLVAVAEAQIACRSGLLSAFGWVSTAALQGIVKPLLEAPSAWNQHIGLAACGMHGVDPGAPLDVALTHADPHLRARALRTAGDLGRQQVLPACLEALHDKDVACRLAAARSALLLGDRLQAVPTLSELALTLADPQRPALAMLLLALNTRSARALVQQLAASGANVRLIVEASGWAGDAQAVPWLLQQMTLEPLARLAGEAFSLITGADLAKLDLERPPPASGNAGPNDDPGDDDVALEDDENLPWPDVAKVQAWWATHGARFSAGTRCFMGASPSTPHCMQVLKTGAQRQRFLAALHAVLANPGTPLFNCAAPAWRQHRQLAALGATT
jgi:uncharacterized protein (TIGR02270 family)